MQPQSVERLTAEREVAGSIPGTGPILGTLSNSVFERGTSTGSGLFASLGSGLVKTLE